MKNCIGLFGTCDNIPWREEFIEIYEEHGIDYFNPDAGDNWHPGLIEDENLNLREDSVILFPILAESLGQGSLGEIGFSVMNVIRNITNGSHQMLVVLIDDYCTDARKTEDERQLSVKTRKLVKSKLLEVKHPNIYVIDSMEDMLELSVELYNVGSQMDQLHLSYNLSG